MHRSPKQKNRQAGKRRSGRDELERRLSKPALESAACARQGALLPGPREPRRKDREEPLGPSRAGQCELLQRVAAAAAATAAFYAPTVMAWLELRTAWRRDWLRGQEAPAGGLPWAARQPSCGRSWRVWLPRPARAARPARRLLLLVAVPFSTPGQNRGLKQTQICCAALLPSPGSWPAASTYCV